ncbi:MAG: alkaline phosphatase family protein [Flavobacteriaceae bacterium]|jgi:predicted AlkP superfamily pyrophosphatase or phosphodiesterase|nr:alkaline phosphatase family protein [Flavobacteriaceae bacterium]
MKIIKKISLIIAVSISLVSYAQIERPKLIVGIVVDQMRMEYLYRFDPYFSENGFKRLINEGFLYTNMHYNYVPTYTAPGHASIYTGTTPVNHGIVGNYWFHRNLKKNIYCTDDASVSPLGDPEKPREGLMSPRNLQSSTITDELRLSTNFRGKVFGVSMKDRGAILPAGHFANRAYWLSDNGNFISSTFYGNDFPQWVTSYNKEKKYLKYINEGWNLYKDISVYKESLPDENPYETLPDISKNKKTVFPYDLKSAFEKNGAKVLKSTPFTSNLVADFAKELIIKEELGKDEDTDFLAVSFSATDIIAHQTSPRSMEVQDTYLRLDDTVADLLSYLDSKVGKGKYLVFLTADHSGAENPLFLHDHKYDVASINEREVTQKLKDFSVKTFGKDFITFYDAQNVFLNEELITGEGKNKNEIIAGLTDYIETFPWVKRTYTEEQILNASPTDEHASMIFRGYDKTQNGQIYILLKPAYMEYMVYGTTHGTSYIYDTHVPAIFFGWKIPQGVSHQKKFITEIAPTISQKVSITLPNSTPAQVLQEILEK